jgi:hypothetical protein
VERVGFTTGSLAVDAESDGGMNFWELRGVIQKSDSSEWRKVDEGPTYRSRFAASYGPGQENFRLEEDSHHTVAVYIPDVDITIAYGMGEDFPHADRSGEIDRHFAWMENFADKSGFKICRADIFWRGSLVDRTDYILVDGYRAALPIGGGHDGLDITEFDRDIARLVDEIDGHREFNSYYSRVPYRPNF